MNVLELESNKLEPVNYQKLIDKISKKLDRQNPFNPFKPKGNRIIIKLDDIAWGISRASIDDPIFNTPQARSATLNFTSDFAGKFPDLIRQIRDRLALHFQSRLNGVDFNLSHFINPLQRGSSSNLSLTYGFPTVSSVPTSGLETRSNGVGSDALLKFHKLTISVSHIKQFQAEMQQGLENYIDRTLANENVEVLEDAREALADLIKQPDSDFYRLQRVVDTESLGKLKKEAKICYLEYLQENLERQESKSPDIVYLKDLIRRLRSIEEYILDPNKFDGDYEVSYQGEILNYRDWFSRSESLDELPIIPIITDILGETTNEDRTERTFTFGVKLKFGNPVQARGGKEVFDYYLDILDPSNWEEQIRESDRETVSRKILRLLLLYYFAFATNSNPEDVNYNIESELDYGVCQNFENKILKVFQGNDEEKKKQILRGLIRGFKQYNVKVKIKRLKTLLQKFIKQQGVLDPKSFHCELGVYCGVLEGNREALIQGRIFEDVVGSNPKKCLRYINVKEAHPPDITFCQLPATIEFEDIRYYQTYQQETFDIEYDGINNIFQVPILIIPESDLTQKITKGDLKGKKIIVFSYNDRHLDRDRCNPSQGFIYRFTMSLLVYITLQVILERLAEHQNYQKDIFLPLLRFHEGDSKNPSLSEEFMADLSKVTAHLLNERYLANSQGIRIKKRDSYKIANALSSLYSVLPKTFTFHQSSHRKDESPPLVKLALILVSSLESDGLRRNRDRHQGISTLFGEAIGITNQAGKTRIQLLKTFSQNYLNRDLYQEPSILSDIVHRLYKLGYRHFLYIAQAPYTSNLNLTNVQDEHQFYFISPTLIRSIVTGLEDVQIYPAFFNKYYVRKSQKLNSTSYSLQDTSNLLNLVKDPSQQVVVFFNLFNGINVGNPDERFYNGVMSYSTLLNIYPSVLDDRDLRQGLIYESSLKQDILRYLTLFHFFRLERSQRNTQLKLDPYERIIGDESLRKNSLFYHMDGRTYFNNLAFLTEVNAILYPPANREVEKS